MSAATAVKFTPRRIGRVLLIVNPASRRAARMRRKALKAFAEAAVECDAMSTEAPGHAATIAKTHAHKYDAVFTLGGDGTVMEVLGALGHQGSSRRELSKLDAAHNTAGYTDAAVQRNRRLTRRQHNRTSCCV